jgi:AcrR family transcriptional regulator
MQVGVDLLAREGLQALTLREVARQAGVSHGAPRGYFPTHLELLSAIARGTDLAPLLGLVASMADFLKTRSGLDLWDARE